MASPDPSMSIFVKHLGTRWYARNGSQLTGNEGVYFTDTPAGRVDLEDWLLRQLSGLTDEAKRRYTTAPPSAPEEEPFTPGQYRNARGVLARDEEQIAKKSPEALQSSPDIESRLTNP